MGEGFHSDVPVYWESRRVCPGGPPDQTLVCAQKGLFIKIDQQTRDVQLVPCSACEADPMCDFESLDANSNNHLDDHELNNCSDAHLGFLCAQCDVDHTNIDGSCVYCTGVNISLVLGQFFSAVCIGIFLMYNTIQVVCPPEEANDVFDAIDTDRNGYLEADEVKDLLDRMGDPISGYRLDDTLRDMTGRTGDINRATIHISRHQFHTWCAMNQNQAGMGVYIFFVQTFGMIAGMYYSDLSIARHVYHSTILIYQSRGMYITLK